MSQSALARAIKKTAGSIWQIENDKYKGVRGDTLIAIAGVLNANPEWIATGYGSPWSVGNPDELMQRITESAKELSPEHQASVLAFIETIKSIR